MAQKLDEWGKVFNGVLLSSVGIVGEGGVPERALAIPTG
jgi:hypothetical protein